MPRQLRRGLVPAAALALTLAVAGCSLPGSGSGGAAPRSSDPASSAPASAPASSGPASAPASAASPAAGQPTPADPSAPAGSAPLGEPFATRTSALGEVKITVQLYPLQRDGAVAHLNLTLRSPATSTRGQVGQYLGDGNGKAGDATYDAADGIQLVDGKNSKLYLTASDGNGTCLCSRGLYSVFLKEDLPVLFSATFAAPPADLGTVDVVVPHFGTVKGVPVQ